MNATPSEHAERTEHAERIERAERIEGIEGPLRHHQRGALAELDGALTAAAAAVEPELLAFVAAHVEHTVAGGPAPPAPASAALDDIARLVEQILVDVARLDDATVARASAHLPGGGLADLVTAAYVIEARTRLRVAAGLLWSEP